MCHLVYWIVRYLLKLISRHRLTCIFLSFSPNNFILTKNSEKRTKKKEGGIATKCRKFNISCKRVPFLRPLYLRDYCTHIDDFYTRRKVIEFPIRWTTPHGTMASGSVSRRDRIQTTAKTAKTRKTIRRRGLIFTVKNDDTELRLSSERTQLYPLPAEKNALKLIDNPLNDSSFSNVPFLKT